MAGQVTQRLLACQYGQPFSQRRGAVDSPPFSLKATAARHILGGLPLEATLWTRCIGVLESELPEQQFNTWVRPLQAIESHTGLQLLAPNRFVVDWVRQNLLARIEDFLRHHRADPQARVTLEVGTRPTAVETATPVAASPLGTGGFGAAPAGVRLNADFTFESFVEGKSNHFAKAAALQVAENPGLAYNPLFIYGGVGLGKTHLMHAVGHLIRQRDPKARVAYVHSERFVSEMVLALQHNTINQFKNNYRTLKIGRAHV